VKQAEALYNFFTRHVAKVYECHPAFAGRKVRFKILVTLFLAVALSIISYSSTFLFSS
jgi:hypothetical protein